MEPALRVFTCYVLEKMKQDEAFAGRLGLTDNSKILWEKVKPQSIHTGNHKKTRD